MADSSATERVHGGIKNLTLTIFGLQVTLVGLFDGSSFFVIVFGLILGLGGVVQVFTAGT